MLYSTSTQNEEHLTKSASHQLKLFIYCFKHNITEAVLDYTDSQRCPFEKDAKTRGTRTRHTKLNQSWTKGTLKVCS